MKYVKNVLLILLLLCVMCTCGILVLWILGAIWHIAFDNIIADGIGVGLIASVLLGVGYWMKKQKQK